MSGVTPPVYSSAASVVVVVVVVSLERHYWLKVSPFSVPVGFSRRKKGEENERVKGNK